VIGTQQSGNQREELRQMRIISLGIIAAGVLGIVGCGGSGGDGSTNPPPPPTVQVVSVSRTSALLEPNETVTITATPRDGSGNALAGKTVTWTANPSANTVSLTPNGASVTITGIAVGSAQVTATVDNVSSTPIGVTVSNTIPTSADVSVGSGGDVFSPDQTDIKAGGTVTFTWAAGPHNVTFSAPPASVPNSGDRSSGTFPVTFAQAGTYNYQCTIHAGMKGSVTVHP
jgi:plastocyanin